VTAEAAGFASKLGTVLTGKSGEVACSLLEGAFQKLISGAVSGGIFGATLSNFSTRDDIPENLTPVEKAAFNSGKFGAQAVPAGWQAVAVAIQTGEQVGTNIVDFPFSPGGIAENAGVSGSFDNFATLLGDVIIMNSF